MEREYASAREPNHHLGEDSNDSDGEESQEVKVSELAPRSWHKRMSKVVQNCNFSGKERKTC